MAISAISFRGTTTAQCVVEMKSAATHRARILEVNCSTGGSTQNSIGIGRPAAVGVGGVFAAGVMQNPADGISQVQYATNWLTTAPTAPTIYHRRHNLGTQAGYHWIWTFPVGLIIPAGGVVTIHNVTSAPLAYYSIVVDE